jgi:hypothetical protein
MKRLKGVVFVIVAVLLGTAVSFGALYMAARIVGPAVRAMFGEPFGYGQDYATSQAWLEATAVRVLTSGIAFLFVGMVLPSLAGRRPWVVALMIANPVSACIGYGIYQRVWSGAFAGEYFGYVGMAVIALTSPLIFAPCIRLGFLIFHHERTRI